ncbi:MAG TPA: hypothetical protein DDZ51_05145 [Planctomycetaceae bacterium]|nr:hypothetical protein [Planctomycetaceae bacterium]
MSTDERIGRLAAIESFCLAGPASALHRCRSSTFRWQEYRLVEIKISTSVETATMKGRWNGSRHVASAIDESDRAI